MPHTESFKRKAKVRGKYVEDVWRDELYKRHGGKCHICGEPVAQANFTVDHIRPASKGGTHSYANTAPAHSFCNTLKADSLMSQMKTKKRKKRHRLPKWYGNKRYLS